MINIKPGVYIAEWVIGSSIPDRTLTEDNIKELLPKDIPMDSIFVPAGLKFKTIYHTIINNFIHSYADNNNFLDQILLCKDEYWRKVLKRIFKMRNK